MHPASRLGTFHAPFIIIIALRRFSGVSSLPHTRGYLAQAHGSSYATLYCARQSSAVLGHLSSMSLSPQHRLSIRAFRHPRHIHPVSGIAPVSSEPVAHRQACTVSILTTIGSRSGSGDAMRPRPSRAGELLWFVAPYIIIPNVGRSRLPRRLITPLPPIPVSSCTDTYPTLHSRFHRLP